MKNTAGRLLVLFALVFFASSVWAAELYLTTFLQASPLKGLDVELDGRPVAATGERGDVTAELDAGSHVVRLLKNAVPLTEYSFSVGEDESAELSITFSDFETPPEISIAKYGAGAQDGASGVLSGVVSDAAGNPVAGARVSIPQTGAEVVTDASGAYSVKLPRGTYTLSVAQPGYRTATSENVRVVANIGVVADVTLRRVGEIPGGPAAPALEDVVVIGVYKPSERSVDKERFAVTITDAISIDELLRFGDTDLAASLRRIVGVAVTGGRYAVVRGLDGRYIASTLNGNLMPSTDPFRRDVQLDLFPNDILAGIEIQKSFSADLPGETTGGIIKINTRGLPDEYINSLSFSLGYTSGVTGDDIAAYEGSDTDWIGIDDGLRELPDALDAASNGGRSLSYCQVQGQQNCITQAEGVALAALLPRIYNARTENVDPDFDLSYALGNLFELSGGTFGAYGAVSYGQKTQARQDAFINDAFSNSGSGSSAFRTAEYVKDQIERTLNGYLVLGYQSGGGWEALSRTTVLRDTEDTTTLESGINQEETPLARTTLQWVERQFFAQQFEGKHYFFERQQLDWRLGLSQTSRYAPDRRTYEYLGGNFTASAFERGYSDLTEDGLDAGLDYSIPVDFSSVVFATFRFGALANARDRDQELVRIGVTQCTSNCASVDRTQDVEALLALENFENGFYRLSGRTDPTDSYTAEQESFAGYLSAEVNFGPQWTVVAGARQDNYTVDLEFPNANRAPVDLESNELLPSLAVIYRPGEAWQLRAGYSYTVSRPNITELAPSPFYDENDRLFFGCPSCEPSTIDNVDLRVEYYFGEKDSISLALFAKEIDQPLEVSVNDASGGVVSSLTFRNNEGATLSGIELDVNKSFIDWADWSLGVGGNVSFIESEIELDDVGQRLEIDPKRDLQGQSPFLANLQLSLDHYPWNQKLTLLANYFDDRIDRVTRNTPSVYEAGRLSLNFNYEKGFSGGSAVKLKLKNLLNEPVEYTQGGRVIERYRTGVEVSLGYSHSF
ncbi:MAG: TonB-dependent receptor domain-containing protein [Gammaproteobacteria bacterium]